MPSARRTEEIDRRTQELTGELEGWMQQLQSMTQRAGSAVREAEALRARETLATAAAADGRVQLSATGGPVSGGPHPTGGGGP